MLLALLCFAMFKEEGLEMFEITLDDKGDYHEDPHLFACRLTLSSF